MTYEELKAEAKKQGYRLVAVPKVEKLLPCTCGATRRWHKYQWDGKPVYSLTCYKCGRTVKGSSEEEVKKNWNEVIRDCQW